MPGQAAAGAIEHLIAHLRNDTTDLAEKDLRVPIEHFVSVERARAEVAVCKSFPVIVAHRSELKSPGDFITREVLGMPLIIARQSDGSAAAFLNMCRHRGGRVERSDAGKKKLFVCQYHGWSYSNDGGDLIGIPYEKSFGGVDRSCNGLIRFKTEERYGLVFVDFSNNKWRSLSDYLGPGVDAQLEPRGLDEAVVYLDKTFELEMNWKMVVDGAIDLLHPQFLHPNGVGKRFKGNVAACEFYGRHARHYAPNSRLVEVAESVDQRIDPGVTYVGSSLLLYPNATINFWPDHVELWTIWPSSTNPSRCTTRIRFLVREDHLSEEVERRLDKSWEILSNAALNEDWPMVRSMQQNVEAWPRGTFLYGRSEVLCQHFHGQLEADIQNLPGPAATADF